MSCFKKNNCVGCEYYYNETIEPKRCHALDNVDIRFDVGDVVKWDGDEYVVEGINIESGGKVSYDCASINNPEIKGIFNENVLEK